MYKTTNLNMFGGQAINQVQPIGVTTHKAQHLIQFVYHLALQ